MARRQLKPHALLLRGALLMLCCSVGQAMAQQPSGATATLSDSNTRQAHWTSRRSAGRSAKGRVEKSRTDALPDKCAQRGEQKCLRLSDGAVVLVDDAWEDAQGIWYRRGGVTNLLERERVKAIERGSHENQAEANTGTDVAKATPASKMAETSVESVASARPIWIYLVGGARFEVDEVTENPNGAWYRRGTLSIFLERARIERIEREPLEPADASLASSLRARGWTTGNASIDGFIRQSGARYGVDPYLIFCVMEQESHFHTRALSPKGAQGLMQLMPGTAARYGVRRPFDPAQNIMGGARYLKELLQQFHGRVDLVLASYNAGEGAVIKFGHNVPPYRETRDYVKRISKRYGQSKHPVEKMTAKAGVEPAARLR